MQMNRMWLPYDQITLENGGGKANELARMKKIGIQVPAFFVLSIEGATALSLRKEGALTNEEKEYLFQMVEQECSGFECFSVRSSAGKEDSEEVSFAGLFDTYLNVSKEELADKILDCLRSADYQHIKDYMYHHQLDIKDVKMAVVIQGMVTAEKAGVLFTANPKGLLNETVLVVGNGLGDGVVEGLVPVTTYYLKRDEDLSYFERQEDSPLLSQKEMKSLLEQADLLRKNSEFYLDCEFAVLEEKVYYLQSRPITTLKTVREESVPVVFNNSNLVESYPGLTLPLTDTFIQFAYQEVFKGVAWRFSRSKELLAAYEDVFAKIVVRINGRMYYNMNHLYSLLQFLPFPNQILPIWQEMMGFSQKDVVTTPELKKKTTFLESLRISGRIIREFFSAPKNMKQLNEDFIKVERYFKQQYTDEMNQNQIKELYQNLADRVLSNWDVTLVNDLYAFVYTGMLKKALKKWGNSEAEKEWNQWFSGIPAITSMEPVISLQKLADFVNKQNLLSSIKRITSDEDFARFMEKDHSGFKERFLMYIDQYGDRSLEELKLETATFRSHPLKALNQLIIFAENTNNKETKAADSFKKLEEIENQIDVSAWKKQIFHYLSKRARLGIQHRETSRLNRSRIYGMVRTMMLRMGEIAVEQGWLEEKEDIFWLTMEEVKQLDQLDGTFDPQKIVARRIKEYKGYELLPAYGYLVFQEESFNKVVQQAEKVIHDSLVDELEGIATSNGKVSGEIIVVTNPSEVKESVEGKILVTKMTDPGWVFLLTQAKGIIAEKGSLLSHTAIISRELGIPAVVGIKNATEVLHTGDQIELDANTGNVTILEREAGRNES